jgi:hypothetical protein
MQGIHWAENRPLGQFLILKRDYGHQLLRQLSVFVQRTFTTHMLALI